MSAANFPHPSPVIPSHRVQLPESDLQLWRSLCLRSAGFPARILLNMSDPSWLESANTLIETLDRLEAAWSDALTTIEVERDRSKESQVQKQLSKALKRLHQRQLPDLDHPVLDSLRQLLNHQIIVRLNYDLALSSLLPKIQAELQRCWRDPSLQEALIWQNRQAFNNMVKPFLNYSAAQTNSSMRQKVLSLASYLQRYTVKNDTIGFFGPLGWGRFDPDLETIAFKPGSSLIAERQLYFEGWAIDVLADSLSDQFDLRPWCSPTLLPNLYVDGKIVHLPAIAALIRQGQLPPILKNSIKSRIELAPLQVRLLQLCDGERIAEQIAQSLLLEPDWNLANETDAYHQIEQLCHLGILRWRLEVPMSAVPERDLRERLNQISDTNLRQSALQPLDRLELAREQVASARSNPEQLNQAIANLENTFSELTQQQATRKPGKTYAGRTLIYEDCRRSLDLSFGQDFLNHFAAPLDLILTSTRWYTYQIAQGYRSAFQEIYDDLQASTGSSEIDLYSFSTQALHLLQDRNSSPIARAKSELQSRWSKILPITTNQSKISYRSADLKQQVETAFAAPHAGWQLARYRSPDLMIAAASQEQISQGNYEIVMGELHLFNTLSRAFAVLSHPFPDQLFTARALDISAPTVVPVPSKQWNTQRMIIHLVAPQDIWFAYEPAAMGKRYSSYLSMGELIVLNSDRGLQVQTRDGRIGFDIVEFFGYTLSNLCMTFPDLLPRTDYTPRIAIDNLVVIRESWRFKVADLPLLKAAAQADQILTICRFAQLHQLPRFVFVKIATELKPYFIDLSSPIYIDLLCKLVRSAVDSKPDSDLTISEMLPSFDRLWLTDAAGEHYTSELRMVVLDPLTV